MADSDIKWVFKAHIHTCPIYV